MSQLLQRGHWPIFLACLVLGIMLAVQYRVTADIRTALPFQRVEDLTARLSQVEKERDALRNQLLSSRQSNDLTEKQGDDIRMSAGYVPVIGPGIIVILDDQKSQAPIGKSDLYTIRHEDILKVLNEVKAAGAEAISINGQRLIATSEIRYVGPSTAINNTHHVAPFEIRVIGDPATLESSLKMRGGVYESLQVWGIRVTIKKQESVEIPAYKGAYQFNYAQPIKGDKIQ